MSPLQFRNHVARLNASTWIDCRGARCEIDQMQTAHLRNAVEWVRRHAAESLHDEIRYFEDRYPSPLFNLQLNYLRHASVDDYATKRVAPFQNMLAELDRRGRPNAVPLQLDEPTIAAIATKVVELMNAKPTKKRGRPSSKKKAA